jgi:GNAT superfamily N-acetyltransferase
MVTATESVTATEKVTVKPLTADRFDDLAALFMQGGDPKGCWCMWFRKSGLTWSNSTPKANRAGLHALAATGPAPGLVAYRDGEAVGWVSLGPRESYERLETSRLLARLDDRPVWSIVCFVVSARSRRQGIARQLLHAAIDYARRKGASMLESYPVAISRGRVPSASAYHGSQSMFAKAGFKVVETRQWNKSSPLRPIMRLELS